MSYLKSGTSPSSARKAVVSLWFRVPQQTIDDITHEYQKWKAENDDPLGDPGPRRRFLGIVPLMTFGPANLNSLDVYQALRETGDFPGWYEETWHENLDCSITGWTETITQAGQWKDSFFSFGSGGEDALLIERAFVLDGSYIGVDCTAEDKIPVLSVNIVMPKSAKASMPGAVPAVVSHTSGPSYVLVGTGVCPGAPDLYFTTEDDFPLPPGILCYTEPHFTSSQTKVYEGNAEVLWGRVPETFRLCPAITAGAHTIDASVEFKGATIAPDHWHHLLLSFDFTKEVKTSGQLVEQTIDHGVNSGESPSFGGEGDRTEGTGMMWVALDDINLTGRKLSAFWPDKYHNLNGVLSINAMAVAQSVNYSIIETNDPASLCNGVDYTITQSQNVPRYSYLPSAVDMSNISLPAAEAYVDAIRRCEMAELQIFLDVSLDTSDIRKRRAFIDAKGNPVAPDKTSSPDDPSSGSIDLLGKRPDILLHSSSNWIKGRNTGSTGVTDEGNQIREGQFTPIGGIASYTPDPSLGTR
jgi:hypothetical protein